MNKKERKKALNIPDAKLPRKPHTVKELEQATKDRVSRINAELSVGLKFIKAHKKSVTFFGSARLGPSNLYAKKAERVAARLAKLGYAIATGGGPGIMQAANKGAFEHEGHSLGFNIKLPRQQVVNPYVNEYVDFYYFFTRKVALSFSAEAYIYFPGGFGTLDELFEIITLVQTHKIPKVPVILVGTSYWRPLDNFLRNTLLKKNKMISAGDVNIYKITDDEDEIVRMIKNSPLRGE